VQEPERDAGSRTAAGGGLDLLDTPAPFVDPADVRRSLGKIGDQPVRDHRMVGRAYRVEQPLRRLVCVRVSSCS